MSEPVSPPSPALPSLGLAVACALHALPLAWAALVLPARAGSWFAWLIGALALLHATVAVLALLRRPRALAIAWLLLTCYSLLCLLVVSVVIASAALYLSELYGDIGRAVAAALAGIWGLLVLLTVPVSAWGLARILDLRKLGWRRLLGPSAGALLTIMFAVLLVRRAAHAEPVPEAASPAAAQALARALEQTATRGTGLRSAPSSLRQTSPSLCHQPLDAARLTLLFSSVDASGAPFSRCLQASDAQALGLSLSRVLSERHVPGQVAKLDLVRGVQRIPRVHPLLEALSLRPGLDGVCDTRGHCFAPWQLVTLDAFTRYRPLDAVRDASFGASLEQLASVLGSHAPAHEPLLRIETESFLHDGQRLVPFARLRPRQADSDRAAFERAAERAGEHILAAQQPDGTFRYLLDPFTGARDATRVNLPRQAGTTLALCELVTGAAGQAAAARALAQLHRFERPSGDASALSDDARAAMLGQTALPLSAFVTCRAAVGTTHDALIGRLARQLLIMQRDDGSFYPEFDLTTQRPTGKYEPLYAGGQAVLALTLVEQLAQGTPSPLWPPRETLHAAVERAMSHYARAYWPRALRSLFYIEENWHCLAARAALASHRHDDYEQFCLDYVQFKSRLILSQADGASPEHDGGYGLSDMFPPHSTATAGFGEALAAALQVKHARGMDLRDDQALMQRVLGFVKRQQWTSESCFACAPGREALGGFSESGASPTIRIDYVQHAMAALGHGARALALAAR